MDDLTKYYKNSVKDIVLSNILSKKDLVTNATLASWINQRDKILNAKKNWSKAKMITLNKKINLYKPTVIYKKAETGFKPEVIAPSKQLSAKKLKEIKKDEQKMIDAGKVKLKNFLKDSDKVVSFYATVYLPVNPKISKSANIIYHKGIHWAPISRNTHGDLRTFFLEYESINANFIYKKLQKYDYIIKTSNENEYNGKEGKFQSIIEEFIGFDELDDFVEFNSIHEAFLIRIDGLSVKAMNKTPTNYIDDKAYDDSTSMFLSHPYIEVDTKKELYTSDYVKKNLKPRSCWLSLLLEVYRLPFAKYYKSFTLTYEHIHNIIGDCPIKPKDNGYSFRQVSKFFDKYNLGLNLFDITFNLVGQSKPKRENKDISPKVLNVIFHNNHIYHINYDLNSLKMKINSLVDKKVIKEPTDKFYLAHKKELENDTMIIDNYDDLVEIINDKKITGTIHLIYQNSCFDLWSDLYTKMKYEASIHMKKRQLDFSGLTLKNINGKNIIIKTYKEDGVFVDKEFGNPKMFHDYIERKNHVYNSLLNKNYISSYSEQVQHLLKECGIGGLVGNFEEIYEQTECVKIDFNKYYASILRDIEKIPVINGFDNFQDYDKHEIKDYNLYYVEKKDCDIKYPINHFSLCYGMNIKDITNELNIIAFLEPSKLKTNITDSLIKDVYADELITTTMKKDIFNHCIGMFNRGNNTNTFSCISNNREEANKMKSTQGGNIVPIKINNNKMYINYIEMKKEITDGFKLISHMVYDRAQKLLFNLKNKVESYGLKVLRCVTDCLDIEINDEKFDIFYNQNKELFDETEMGKLKIIKEKTTDDGKIEKITVISGSCIAIRRLNNVYHRLPASYKKELTLNNEWDREEMKNILDNYKNLILKADIAGAGKTNALVHYCKENKLKTLFICPWNSLCFNLKSKGNDALTLDKVIGLRFDGNDFKKGKEYDVEDYDVIVFDEIFLYSTCKLQNIKEFMDKHKKIRFYATGDENQNKPIETLNISNSKVYYNNIISEMFFNSITLHENKRCLLKEDREKMKSITDAIRTSKCKQDALEVLKKNFKIIYDEKDIVTKKNVCALNRTCEWINELVHQPFEGEVFYEGLDIICRKSLFSKGLKLTVNNTYEIINIEDGVYWIHDGYDLNYVNKDILKKHFRLSYARTCHSYQGMSEEEAITIFDVNHFMVDIDWIYTAITRSTAIENIYIFMGKSKHDKEMVDLKNQIRAMIDGHVQSDNKNKRLIENKKYVDTAWTLNQLKNNNKCIECHQFMDVSLPECFSIDRIDNNLGHYEFNCRVICRRCNCAKK